MPFWADELEKEHLDCQRAYVAKQCHVAGAHFLLVDTDPAFASAIGRPDACHGQSDRLVKFLGPDELGFPLVALHDTLTMWLSVE